MSGSKETLQQTAAAVAEVASSLKAHSEYILKVFGSNSCVSIHLPFLLIDDIICNYCVI